jgi:hypothetical protein
MSPDNGEDRRAYLGFIQGTITRLSGASFQIKAWAVALGSVVIGLTAKDNRADLAWIALMPGCIFWFLDAYYLQLETRYRHLFNKAVSAQHALFDMDAGKFTIKDVIGSMWRPSVFPIYLLIVALALLVVVLGKPASTHDTSSNAATVSPSPATH